MQTENLQQKTRTMGFWAKLKKKIVGKTLNEKLEELGLPPFRELPDNPTPEEWAQLRRESFIRRYYIGLRSCPTFFEDGRLDLTMLEADAVLAFGSYKMKGQSTYGVLCEHMGEVFAKEVESYL